MLASIRFRCRGLPKKQIVMRSFLQNLIGYILQIPKQVRNDTFFYCHAELEHRCGRFDSASDCIFFTDSESKFGMTRFFIPIFKILFQI